jgi:molybdate transport system substrate-binding protein
MLSAPMQRVVARFQEQRPGVEISVLVDKPLAQLAALESGNKAAGVAITLGEIEMNSLLSAGVVRKQDVRSFAVNGYPIVAVAPAAGTKEGGGSLKELASPAIKRILIEDPSRSSLGDRATRGLEKAGLWPAVSAKVVRPEAEAMILAELLDGSAEAALVLKGCLFAEKGPQGAMPKTIRIVGELSPDSYPPIVHRAAPMARAGSPEVAREFVAFLGSPEGRQAITEAGLRPPTEPDR